MMLGRVTPAGKRQLRPKLEDAHHAVILMRKEVTMKDRLASDVGSEAHPNLDFAWLAGP